MKGPGIFLAQFAGNEAPFNSLERMGEWASRLGYRGVQVPTHDPMVFDLQVAASSQAYCDDIKGRLGQFGVEITELSTHLQGQLLAVHPAYVDLFRNFADPSVRDRPDAWPEWATQQLKFAARASERLGLKAHATFSGALLWHTMYPWPQRTPGLVEEGFAELARRWQPLLDVFAAVGVDLCYEIHPGEDLHDGVTFERFLAAVNNHEAANILYDPSHFVLQQLDYVRFIDHYHSRIKAFHVKDAEFRPNGKSGVYGGYQDWMNRPGRFRSLGDGQVDFKQVFSKFAQYGYKGWAVLEWECCLKHAEDGAREGAPFIRDHMIRTTSKRFDDFASSASGINVNGRILGMS